MAIGEIVGFVNSNPRETLDRLIKRMAQSGEFGGGGLNVEVINFTTSDIFPFVAEIGKDCIAFVQELRNYVFISRDDDLITDAAAGVITVNVVKPFNGRIVLVRQKNAEPPGEPPNSQSEFIEGGEP